MRSASRFFERSVGAATRRPLLTVALVALLALAGGVLALRLDTSTATDTLVGDGNAAQQATERLHARFGDDAVVVLVRVRDLPELVLTDDLGRVLGLEGCLSGNVPRGVVPPGGRDGPCAELGRLKPVRVVYGPGTFVNESVRQIQDQFVTQQRAQALQADRAERIARAEARRRKLSPAEQRLAGEEARRLVEQQFFRTLAELSLRYGIRSVPTIRDTAFVSTLVFDGARGYNQPKARFAYLFPSSRSALIQVRLKPGLSDAERRRTIALVREAVAMPEWRLQRSRGSYVVSGAPVVLSDLAESITTSIFVLLVAAIAVMAMTLLLVFRARGRLLPLGLALGATAITFGAMSLAGWRLTMASIAVLPVLIGLAVDYAIQFQARFEEALAARGDPRTAAIEAARGGGPTITVALSATLAGFLVLLLSPVPMVRDFALLLLLGIVVAWACAFTAGLAALVLLRRGAAALPPPLQRAGAALGPPVRGAGELLGSAGRGARDLIVDHRPLRWLADGARERARRVLAGAAAEPEPPRDDAAYPPAATRVLVRRAVAHLLDRAVLGGAAFLLVWLELPEGVTAAGILAVLALYLVVLQGRFGWTPGKLALGLRVAGPDGGPPGARAALFRSLPLVVEVAGLVALFVMRRSEYRQRVGDRWAGTLVVRAEAAPATGATRSLPRRPLALVAGGPAFVLAAALALAVAGWAVDTRAPVESDIERLVPQDTRVLRDLDTLQRATGVSGQIDVLVEARDLTDPAVIRWMSEYQQEVLEEYGYSRTRGCGRAEVCPALSLPDLFQNGTPTDRERIRTVLETVPPYFSQSVIVRDPQTRRFDTATLSFGIRLMPLERQQRIIEDMRERLDPPPGVRARMAGLPVLAAQANDAVSSGWRRALMVLGGLLLVGLVLLLWLRTAQRALVPLVPIAMATGWSSLAIYLMGVTLNPLSVTLGALVIAITTEFSVLLSERFRQERERGLDVGDALARTYRSTGAAVLASGVTAVAGFAVLALSDIRLLRDFGLVTVIDLAVSLLGVLIVLPSVLVLSERGELLALPGRAWRALTSVRLPRPRRPRIGRPRLRRPRLPRRPRRRPSAA